MNFQELEQKLLQMDSQLLAREGALEINLQQMEEQIEAIQLARDQHSELIEVMNAMRIEGQSVVAELGSTKNKNKNKTLLKEKRFL
ncbi:hypothetical protein AYI70_g3068 [Smittium culicis]|uniref:Uncharacterized protein n=1 Tax=Smittium culicis TaxID=133412 RepID=A0A1R1Y563_9FUNG|nr:hypothetical protein AYI70_g3068 [Smittium culicis]